mgnify:CR=1 FL=1
MVVFGLGAVRRRRSQPLGLLLLALLIDGIGRARSLAGTSGDYAHGSSSSCRTAGRRSGFVAMGSSGRQQEVHVVAGDGHSNRNDAAGVWLVCRKEEGVSA